MIELDGRKYIVSTPAENTQDMLDRINAYCTENNVTNSKGEVVSIEKNFASPFYLILWALGYLVTVIQNLVYSCAKGLNVQMASDDQLLNLADMAAVARGQASVTTFNLMVRAMDAENSNYDENANEGKCVITSEDTITYQGVVYKPAVRPNITLEPGQYGYITMVAQTSGSNQIAASTITAFDSTIANLDSISQPDDAIPGQAQESIASLRQRIQRKQYSGTSIDSAIDAVRALEGVTMCNITYNESNTETMNVGEDALEVPPRSALIIVQGYNPNIAQAYFKFLTAPTCNWEYSDTGEYTITSVYPANRLLEVQEYVTHAQQRIPCVILKPKVKPVYVRVILGVNIESSVEDSIKNTVASTLMSTTVVGEDVTSAKILQALTDFATYSIVGTQVSMDGENWNYRTYIAQDVILTYKVENISVVMPGVW